MILFTNQNHENEQLDKVSQNWDFWSMSEILNTLSRPGYDLFFTPCFNCWCLIFSESDFAELYFIYVKPLYRSKGYAKKALCHIFEFLKTRNNTQRIFLEVRADNHAAIQLYSSHEMTQCGIKKGYYNNGDCDAVLFVKQL